MTYLSKRKYKFGKKWRFSYTLYIRKNGPKWVLKWSQNGQKCSKWAEIWTIDVFLCVLSNSKRFLKNFKIWPIFGQKTAIFCIFRVAILVPRFLRKPLKLPQKCFKWLDFWYTDSLGCMQQSYVWDFENFEFSLNYDPFYEPKQHFLAKLF